jgi:Domain of unknown function (DUF4878)
MKPIISITLLITLFTACNPTPGNSPKAVVAAFMEAAKKGDMESLKQYLTSEDISMMALAEGFLTKLDPVKAKEMKDKMANPFKDKTIDATIDIKDEKVEGNTATVQVDFTSKGKTESHPFSLQKQEGIWKISLLSTGINGTGVDKEKMEQGMQQMKEPLKSLDGLSDSLSKGMDKLKRTDIDSLKKLMKNSKVDVEKIKEVLKAAEH